MDCDLLQRAFVTRIEHLEKRVAAHELNEQSAGECMKTLMLFIFPFTPESLPPPEIASFSACVSNVIDELKRRGIANGKAAVAE